MIRFLQAMLYSPGSSYRFERLHRRYKSGILQPRGLSCVWTRPRSRWGRAFSELLGAMSVVLPQVDVLNCFQLCERAPHQSRFSSNKAPVLKQAPSKTELATLVSRGLGLNGSWGEMVERVPFEKRYFNLCCFQEWSFPEVGWLRADFVVEL